MEREIGEIFRYKGCLYKTLERQDDDCYSCCFNTFTCKFYERGECSYRKRKDRKSVMFEYIDDPDDCQGTFSEDLIPKDMGTRPFNLEEAMNGGAVCTRLGVDVRIICFDRDNKNYPIVALVGKKANVVTYTREGRFQKIGPDNVADMVMKPATDKDNIVEEIGTCDDIHPDVIEKAINISLYGEPKTKPFNIEAARTGKPVCTKNYADARIVCFDVDDGKNILALVKYNGKEIPCVYGPDGKFICGVRDDCGDLVMLVTHKVAWQNLFKNGDTYYVSERLYEAEEDATPHILADMHDPSHTYVDTVRIEWEE